MKIMNLEIIKIFDKKNNLEIKDLYEIKKFTHMYSNTKIPVYKLIINNKPITRNNSLCTEYKCLNCKLNSIITLNIFLRKLNRNNIKYCGLCKNTIEDKRENHTNYMKINCYRIIKGEKFKKDKKEKTLEDKLLESTQNWENETDDFKDKYNLIYITDDEFIKIKDKIKSVNNDSIILNNNWSYMYNFVCYNQQKFNPVLINKSENTIIKPYYIKFNCENCGEDFITKNLATQKNRIKILCKDCSFCNRIFKVKHITIFGNKIKYNSNYEKRFLTWCEENNIMVKNGPVIDYIWNDKNHKYYLDFEIIDKKILLEFKDNHIWRKQHIESGKFEQKNKYTNIWCKENNYTFHIIFPKNLSEIKKKLLSL